MFAQTRLPAASSLRRHLLTPTVSTRHLSQDWSSAQYLKFANQRARPALDLLSQVPLSSPSRVLDVGCGPGNSTELLVERYPSANVRGIDSSPDMIAQARKTLPNVRFELVDLMKYEVGEPVDLMFSNAVLHWVPADERISVMQKLVRSLQPGGVFAMQVPDNYHEPSHSSMRATAASGPWSDTLGPLKPALEPFDSPQRIYDALKPLCESVDIWHTAYQHPLESHEGIVEWVKGTGLRPFLDPLGKEDRRGFLEGYLGRLREEYPVSGDGRVLLRYPRLFVVALRG